MVSEAIVLETDGASKGNPGRAGAGYILSKDNHILAKGKAHIGVTTNNVAEYKAMIMGLERALELGATNVRALTDSTLLAEQIQGRYRVRKPHLRTLHSRCLDLISRLEAFTIEHIPSSVNHAHRLAEEAAEGSGTKPI